MTDQIVLTGVSATGYHGVLDHERREGQTFVVDVVMDVDLAPAGASDDLADTVSYAEVAGDVVSLIEGGAVENRPDDPVHVITEILVAQLEQVGLASRMDPGKRIDPVAGRGEKRNASIQPSFELRPQAEGNGAPIADYVHEQCAGQGRLDRLEKPVEVGRRQLGQQSSALELLAEPRQT